MNTPVNTRIWPLAVVGLMVVAGIIGWDFGRHERVKQFVGHGSDIPGAAVPDGPGAAAEFQRVKTALTQTVTQGDRTIRVTWDTPGFFRALAAAEGAQDIKRHETLYHAYAERFNLHRDLVFSVVIEAASADLRNWPVKQNSSVRNDKGDGVAAWQWREARGASARHLEGVLLVPQRTEAGAMILGHRVGEHLPGERAAGAIELTIGALPGGQDAVLRWSAPPNWDP